ncbi:MAG: hypothetical protein ABI162_00030 [Luteolibacter sp.]
MKPTLSILGTLGLLSSFALAGSVVSDTTAATPTASTDAFSNARRPMTNPTLFDLALPTTNVHPLFIYHGLPDNINTIAGKLPLGGDVEVYALQLEYAVNERLSIVATKDGYVDMNPDNTLSNQNGWGNIAAGAKYAFIYDPAAGTAVSGTMTIELPTGNHDVFQGSGDGSANLLVSGLKMVDAWQFAGGTGLVLPFSDQQSTSAWLSAHASYEVCPWFIPLVELNWFHVLSPGDGTDSGVVPKITKFEGGDYFNLGAEHSDENRDLVTAAIGFRSRINKSVDVGLAYELPLTDKEDSLMEERVTLDVVWKF